MEDGKIFWRPFQKRAGMQIGKLWGSPVKIHWTMLAAGAGYFYAGCAQTVLLVMGAVLLHEFAHAIAAHLLKVEVTEIQLFPFGGQAKIEDFTAMQPYKEISIALAGPAASLMLAGLFLYGFSSENHMLRQMFIQINWRLFLFNLLPALPLDGGRILRAGLGKILGYRRATQITAGLGQTAGIFFAASGWNQWAQGNGFNQMLIGAVLFWTACREQRFFSYSFMRFLLHHKQQLRDKGLLPVNSVVCTRHTEVRRILQDVRPQQYLWVTVVDEQQRMLGHCSESQLIDAFMEQGTHICVQDILKQS